MNLLYFILGALFIALFMPITNSFVEMVLNFMQTKIVKEQRKQNDMTEQADSCAIGFQYTPKEEYEEYEDE